MAVAGDSGPPAPVPDVAPPQDGSGRPVDQPPGDDAAKRDAQRRGVRVLPDAGGFEWGLQLERYGRALIAKRRPAPAR